MTEKNSSFRVVDLINLRTMNNVKVDSHVGTNITYLITFDLKYQYKNIAERRA